MSKEQPCPWILLIITLHITTPIFLCKVKIKVNRLIVCCFFNFDQPVKFVGDGMLLS